MLRANALSLPPRALSRAPRALLRPCPLSLVARGGSHDCRLASRPQLSVNGMHNFMNKKPKSCWSSLFCCGTKKKSLRQSKTRFALDEKGRVMTPAI